MMRRLFKAVTIVIFLSILCISCRKVVEIDSLEKKLFLEETVMGCYKDGHEYMVYQEELHQMSLNPKRHVIRIQSEDQKEYYHMDMESYPRSVGVNILADFSVSVEGSERGYTFVFECSRIDGGKMWLWNKENKLGIIIPVH